MEETKKKKERTSVKKVLGAFLALVMVAVISVVGTLAYLSDKADSPLVNEFTGSSDISISLTEPTWETTGKEKAKQYTPGLTIEKDPKITNDTTVPAGGAGDYSEWVAMRVDYQKAGSDVTYSELIGTNGVISELVNSKIYDSNNNIDGTWFKVTPKTDSDCKFDIYVYKIKLNAGNSGNVTDSLFEKVTINNNISKDNDEYPSFMITVNAAAIKNEQEFGNISALTSSKLTYNGFASDDAEWIIMNELVKLLTVEGDNESEYQSFTGLKTDGTAVS